MFRKKDSMTAEAVIVEQHIKHHGGGIGLNDLSEWVADVTSTDGQTRRVVIPLPNLATDFREPSAGDVVGVLVDPKNGRVKFDKSDPRLSLKAERAEGDRRFQATASGPVGSKVDGPTTPSDTAQQSVTTVGAAEVVSASEATTFLQAFLSGDSQASAHAIADLRAHSTAPSIADRLSQLEQLKATGALSADEYEAQRQKIVSSI
jgi:hypothetical protein